MRRTGPKKKRATMRLKRCLPEGEGTRTNTLPRGYASSRHRTSYSIGSSLHTRHIADIPYLDLVLAGPKHTRHTVHEDPSINPLHGYIWLTLTGPQYGVTCSHTHTHTICLAHHGGRSRGSCAYQLTHTHTHSHTHSLFQGHRQWFWHVQGWL